MRIGPATTRRRIAIVYVLLALVNVAVWAWAWLAFHDRPVLLGTAFLAYSFGLRHAVDADHLAAIDNVTRKLMQDGQRPVAVGLFFALGHSTMVILASVVIAVAESVFRDRFAAFQGAGGVVATLVSASFLLLIAALNAVVLVGVWRRFRQVRAGGATTDEDMNALLAGGGLLARIFRPLFRVITRSWHMLPLGFLFGLGFDTATEVGLLGISAAEAQHGLPIWSILVFPALFTAGMTLVDTTDSVLMLGAYGWAFTKPVRKLYYNLTITALSVLVAVLVGGIEALGLLGDQMALKGAFWEAIGRLRDHFAALGFIIIAVFALGWAASMLIYRWKRYDELEARSLP